MDVLCNYAVVLHLYHDSSVGLVSKEYWYLNADLLLLL